MIIIFFTVLQYKYVVANIYTILLILFDIQAKCIFGMGDTYVLPTENKEHGVVLVSVKYTVRL